MQMNFNLSPIYLCFRLSDGATIFFVLIILAVILLEIFFFFREKKRDQYHRRRMFDPDAPIDYINERNRKFNQKLDRFYDKYTEDLKSDLERGTAI